MNDRMMDEWEDFKRNKQEMDEYELHVMIEEYKKLTPKQKIIYNKLMEETNEPICKQ
jgi:Spy/CpxP family protein refolding chaperone